ncbi:guanine nucleotide exchange factor MSS4 homolog [Phlebotomus argentipes]|uniref:guanine nucleotide exchange factor MSS4 homolog n=1 Tax=Phlebotomus argentipes TaxID=94469 RepID=UPI0028934AEB|nr:guanine nucleotide exchange factor MSS4 homolog [Phlebotomus argentipes]
MEISLDGSKYSDEVEEGKNKRKIECTFCNSSILRPQNAQFANQQFSLPLMRQKNVSSAAEAETEEIKEFWMVDDMFTFENIGVSHTVNNTKFLVCADCEMGPVGYHDIPSRKSYVALSRVKHV